MHRSSLASKSLTGTLGTTCLVALAVACLTNCASTEYADKADEVVEAPDGEATIEGLGADRWCSDFGDPKLDQMVERAWSGNMQLKAAWARLEQAEAAAEIAESSLWPIVGANAGAEYSDGGVGNGGEFDRSGASWELSAAAAYEVDIWGRNRHLVNAAEFEAEAVEADTRGLAITLTSQVAEAWFDVVAQRQRLELLAAQLETSKDVLAIIRIRARRGVAAALDLAQQEQNVESLQGEVFAAKGQLRTSLHRLAVLVGEPPSDEEFVDSETLPAVEPLDASGVPGDLLERRPDVRAAYLLLEAADERTAAAVADRLPRLQLSASVGFQAEQLAKLFEQLFFSIGANIAQPIFEGGQLRAAIERSEAVAKEQLYIYADTLLVAMREVLDALALEENQHAQIESLERELSTAESVLKLARERYRLGAVDYLRVLTGLRGLQEVQRELLEARRQQISHRIALCRALGGSWVESVEPSIDNED